jgi:branched-subunit amino acid transport protein
VTYTLELLTVAVGTYLFRSSVVLLAAGRTIPPRWEAVLQLIPPAVLAALVANALVLDGTEIRPFGPWYVAAAVAAVVAWRTRSAGWTLLVGMPVVWVLTAIW